MNNPAADARLRNLAPLALPLVCLAWAFWPTFVELVVTWKTSPQYSHGFLVPVFAAFLLWTRRDRLPAAASPDDVRFRAAGAAVLLLGVAVRLMGTYWFFNSADAISILPCVAGVVLLVGGRDVWRWAWPGVLFLAFMIPLPFRVANALSEPLQRLATVSSTFVMQTLGLPALAEGNVILLNEHLIGIVEACSGLRMLVVFFALSTAMVLVVRRHWVDRVIILLSAAPIAVISNILRVTVTGVMYDLGYSEMASHFFHDVAGWLMMPLALGMLWAELWFLGKLFIDAPAVRPAAAATAQRTSPAPRPPMPRTTRQPLKAQPPRQPGARPRTSVAADRGKQG
jgi:exosortase